MSLQLPGDIIMLGMFKATPRFVEIYQPLRIDSVAMGTPAAKIGLTPADKILSINGQKVETFNAFTNEMGRIDDQLAAATTAKDSAAILNARLTVLNHICAARCLSGIHPHGIRQLQYCTRL